jgi:hypothetical protein
VKAERLPTWAFRRLNTQQREAYNLLRYYSPGPAERARLKQVLGWRRTREETIALARELLADGLMIGVVADRCGIGRRYLARLLEQAENGSPTPENTPDKPLNQAAVLAVTRETGIDSRPARQRPPAQGFATFSELDRWLEENGA